mmetsp:Transcript_2041/g.2790  ORF Transcript_2041/g.2790 Transcript_2041/m.2790 type:complete len:297 (-) Transcript_2041:753-1643(-)
MSTSFNRMRIFSRISASACELLWMRFTYLLRSFLTTSYSAENSLRRLEISLQRLVRSRMSSSLMRTCCLASFSLASMRALSRPLMSLCADSTDSSLPCRLPSASSVTTCASSSSTSALVSSSSRRFSLSTPSNCRKRTSNESTSALSLACCLVRCVFSSCTRRRCISWSLSCVSRPGCSCRADSQLLRFFFSCRFSRSKSFSPSAIWSFRCRRWLSISRLRTFSSTLRVTRSWWWARDLSRLARTTATSCSRSSSVCRLSSSFSRMVLRSFSASCRRRACASTSASYVLILRCSTR